LRAGFSGLAHKFNFDLHPRLGDLLLPSVPEEVADTMRSFHLRNAPKA